MYGHFSGESEDERKKDLEKSDDNRPKDPISSIKTKGELGLNVSCIVTFTSVL